MVRPISISSLEKVVLFEPGVMFLHDEDVHCEIKFQEEDLERFKWMLSSDAETTFVLNSDEWELFLGPFIDGEVTGYIFQAINKISRKVATIAIPFSEGISVKNVKEFLRKLLG